MMVEKINEVPQTNLASQNFPNITIKADKKIFKAMRHKHKKFYLTCPMKIKLFIFGNNKKTSQIELWGLKYCSR